MENQDLPNKTLQDILTSRDQNGGFGDKRIRRSRDFKFYGITQARTGSAELSLSLKIITSNNEQLIIPYHDIATPMRFDGKSTIQFTAASIHLTIEGKGLDKIIDYLAEHRLVWLKEPESTAETMLGEDNEEDIIIHSIDIKTLH